MKMLFAVLISVASSMAFADTNKLCGSATDYDLNQRLQALTLAYGQAALDAVYGVKGKCGTLLPDYDVKDFAQEKFSPLQAKSEVLYTNTMELLDSLQPDLGRYTITTTVECGKNQKLVVIAGVSNSPQCSSGHFAIPFNE